MLPLSFREFIKIFSPEVYEKLPIIEKMERVKFLGKLILQFHF
jgi:hypothetical protein